MMHNWYILSGWSRIEDAVRSFQLWRGRGGRQSESIRYLSGSYGACRAGAVWHGLGLHGIE